MGFFHCAQNGSSSFNTIINILLENIFSNNNSFSSYEKLVDNYENNVRGNQFETPKRYSFKNGDKTLGNEIIITQSRYEVLSDSNEIDTKRYSNHDDELSNNVTTSISSRQVYLRNNDIHKDKIKTNKRNEKGCSVTVVVGDSIVKIKGWKLSTKDDLFVRRSFPGAKTDDMESYIKPTLKDKPERIIIHCGTNNLKNSTPQSTAENILSLANLSQQENKIVLVSSIVPRKDHLD